MKHKIKVNFILFLIFLIVVDSYAKPKNDNRNTQKTRKKTSIPVGFKITQDSYIAASILKTLGVKVNLEALIVKFQRNCKKLNVVKSINRSIQAIKSLTRKKSKNLFNFSKRRFKKISHRRRRAVNRSSRKRRNNNSRRSNKDIFENDDDKISNNQDSMFSTNNIMKGRTIRKKGKKTNKIKQLCKSQGFYNSAVGKLKGTKAKLKKLKKKKLIQVIKRTLRRVLARILGCKFVRKSRLSRVIRRTLRKITNKRLTSNVFKIAKVLKKISKNYKPKPKTVKKARKIIRSIFTKLVKGKKLKPITIMLTKRMAKKNCEIAKKCFANNIFSRKCFSVSKLCLNMKSIVKKIKANKVGNIVSGLIKRFIS